MKLFAKTLHALDATQRIDIRSLDCDQNEAWGYGSTILNYIKMVPMPGLTGLIDFNNTGYRTDITLDVIQLKKQVYTILLRNSLYRVNRYFSKD